MKFAPLVSNRSVWKPKELQYSSRVRGKYESYATAEELKTYGVTVARVEPASGLNIHLFLCRNRFKTYDLNMRFHFILFYAFLFILSFDSLLLISSVTVSFRLSHFFFFYPQKIDSIMYR